MNPGSLDESRTLSLSELKRFVRSARERAHSRATDEVDRLFQRGEAGASCGQAEFYREYFNRFYRQERQDCATTERREIDCQRQPSWGE